MSIALFFVLGLVLLVGGAELLVRGASRLASTVGLSPLVIGLTVVAFGTSAPELFISVTSAWRGQADLALGNVVGSNIFNVLFILGISALVTPLVVSARLVRLDVPVLIVVSALVWALGLDGRIGRVDGALLVAGLVGYTVFTVVQSRRESAAVRAAFARQFGPSSPGVAAAVPLVAVIAGLGLLVLGSRWLVASAVEMAQRLGVSELLIGLTIVAAGTSLPEVATSVVAALRGERDIAAGNIVGSGIFNVLAVLGLTAMSAPAGVAVAAAALRFDIPVMVAAAVACLPIFFTGHLIARWEGALFLAYYLAYTSYLLLVAIHHAALPAFGHALAFFVVPLTVITLAVATARSALGAR
jgi:cation:H+ antiporter